MVDVAIKTAPNRQHCAKRKFKPLERKISKQYRQTRNQEAHKLKFKEIISGATAQIGAT